MSIRFRLWAFKEDFLLTYGYSRRRMGWSISKSTRAAFTWAFTCAYYGV